MTIVFEWINNHNWIISAISTIALVWITRNYARDTKKLAELTQKQVEMSRTQVQVMQSQLSLEYVPNVILTGAEVGDDPFSTLYLTNLGRYSIFFQYATTAGSTIDGIGFHEPISYVIDSDERPMRPKKGQVVIRPNEKIMLEGLIVPCKIDDHGCTPWGDSTRVVTPLGTRAIISIHYFYAPNGQKWCSEVYEWECEERIPIVKKISA